MAFSNVLMLLSSFLWRKKSYLKKQSEILEKYTKPNRWKDLVSQNLKIIQI